MRNRKPINSGVLAFLDIMACGLGAAVLLFVLIDFNSDIVPDLENAVINQASLDSPNNEDTTEKEIKNLKVLENQLAFEYANAVEKEVNLDLAIALKNNSQSEKIETKNITNKSGQLIGLKVDGSEIIILLDSSSSMYSEYIDENLHYSLAPSLQLSLTSKKWAQAKKIVSWIVAVAPASSKIIFSTFSDTLVERKILLSNASAQRSSFLSQLNSIFPSGPTTLGAAFDWLASKKNAQVFLITDGLPTKMDKKSLFSRLRSACAKDPKGFVSGKCRAELMIESVKKITHSKLAINIILLPLEGDPLAAPMFWKLANQKKGILFMPEANWP